MRWLLLSAALSVAALWGLGQAASAGGQAKGGGKVRAGIEKMAFGNTKDGIPVDLYVLTNARGMKAKIMTYGTIVTELYAPDRNGKFDDVVLGFDNLDDYLKGHPFFGAIAGRVANRIAKGRFMLDGNEYKLAVNNGPNALHGGLKGFDKAVWKAELSPNADAVGFTYLSKDGEEGYPGNLSVAVTYQLTDKNELEIHYEAKTDKATPVNLTNHSYFNLQGITADDILNHQLMIAADKYTPADDTLIPTGELKPVQGTPFDFTKPMRIGSRIDQVKGGYDVNFVLRGEGKSLALAARAHEPKTGRVMEMYTTEPGVQFYTGNFLDGSLKGIGGVVYQKHHGFCLEAQHFPDSVNHPNFPSVILRPGQTYTQTTVYKFSAK